MSTNVNTELETLIAARLPIPPCRPKTSSHKAQNDVFAVAAQLGFSADEIKELQRVYAHLLRGEVR